MLDVPLDIVLDHDRGVPVYRQIVEAVLASLAGGRLRRDEQLPTIHQLAQRLGINPNTVARAYRELEQGGFIKATRGRGTFPVLGAPPSPPDRARVLASIYRRALAEGARHNIDAVDIARYFQESSS